MLKKFDNIFEFHRHTCTIYRNVDYGQLKEKALEGSKNFILPFNICVYSRYGSDPFITTDFLIVARF